YDLNEMARLTAASPVPIAYGEHCFTIHDFRQLVEYEAADILQPDATVCGGISEALRVTHFGEAMGYRVVPHCAGLTAIGWAASVHFAACMPKFTVFEYDSSPEQPLRDELATEPLFSVETVVDGQIAVPTGPGLGVEIDEAFFKEFAYDLDERVARSFPTYATPHI
ncbi:mandelate racemase/muconate lactonizing enzyme family protein, partial [Chloroflexota bacterium]